MVAVEEWLNLKGRPFPASAKPVERWLPPDKGWFKVNSDAAFLPVDCNGGGGVVIRDHYSGFIAGASHFCTFVADAEGAELLACRRGITLARELQVSCAGNE